MFVVMFIRDNLPRAYDFMWFRKSWAYMTGGARALRALQRGEKPGSGAAWWC